MTSGVSLTEIRLAGEPALEGFLVRPERPAPFKPGVVICHGFPSAQRPGVPSRSYQTLAERVAEEQGWTVLAISLRGCGGSGGQFSMSGWVEDLGRAVDELRSEGCGGVWIVGSTTGGSLAIMAAGADPEIRGVAVMAARADFDDWWSEPRRFLTHCRNVGVITDPVFPSSTASWGRELKRIRPLDAAKSMGGRSLMILHGTEDRQVPHEDARVLADAHGSAELRLIGGANHRIRHDPRAVAVLMGWLERQAAQQIRDIA
ncbi:MAG: alpha/beta hydrolase family protein [Acidimicrobiales bacterium]